MAEKAIVEAEPAESKRKPPPGRRGGFGRQKGTPNKATAEIKAALGRFLTDPDYQDNLMTRIEQGRADHMEKYFWELIYGRPKVVVEVGAPSPTQALAEQFRQALTKEERMQLAELSRKAIQSRRAEATVIETRALPAAKKPK